MHLLIALFSLPKARAKNLLEERNECPHYDSFMCSDHPFVSSRVTTNPAEDDAPSIRRRVDRHGNGDVTSPAGGVPAAAGRRDSAGWLPGWLPAAALQVRSISGRGWAWIDASLRGPQTLKELTFQVYLCLGIGVLGCVCCVGYMGRQILVA